MRQATPFFNCGSKALVTIALREDVHDRETRDRL